MASVKDFFTEEERKQVEEAIRLAELNTSGEIRIHLESSCKEDVLDRAAKLFHKLEMDKTKLRNGVLFYVAIEDHKLAVIGDSGIDKAVPANFWDDIKNDLIAKFKENRYAEGLTEAIGRAGLQLKAHFPYQSGDSNELSNEMTFDN